MKRHTFKIRLTSTDVYGLSFYAWKSRLIGAYENQYTFIFCCSVSSSLLRDAKFIRAIGISYITRKDHGTGIGRRTRASSLSLAEKPIALLAERNTTRDTSSLMRGSANLFGPIKFSYAHTKSITP